MNITRQKIGSYERGLETEQFIFFVNFREFNQVKMYEKIKGKLDLLSDNIFGLNRMLDILESNKFKWIHPSLDKFKEKYLTKSE